LQLVQEKIDFWEKRETSRQEDFKAIKKVLKEAMNSSSIGKGEVIYIRILSLASTRGKNNQI
jgi:hypothetical protein